MIKRHVDEYTLAALIDAGVVREAIIICVPHQGDGDHKWAIQLKYGLNTQTLWSKREHVRLFPTIDTAAKLLHECGPHQMQIDFI